MSYCHIVLYNFLWIFPVGISWLLANSGRYFSFIGQYWQDKNVNLVGIALIIATVLGTFAALIVMKYYPNSKFNGTRDSFLHVTGANLLFLGVLAFLSGYGLFESFGATIFERAYGGPQENWLGNGAWSISYILSIYILSILIIEQLSIFLTIIFVTVVFAPILLAGSRLDYISVQLAIICYILFIDKRNIKVRLMSAFMVSFWTVSVAHAVGAFRNMQAETVTIRNILVSPVEPIHDDFLNLSTFGDIGASVFQTIGLVKGEPSRIVGWADALKVYVDRMLPGPLFPDRPSGFLVKLPKNIGNGATHSLAEGYFISGIFGIMMVSLFIGIILGLSVIAGRAYRATPSLSSLIIFAFPWLLLIRGSWYQFFAFFKAIEIFVLIFTIMMVIKWMQGYVIVRLKR